MKVRTLVLGGLSTLAMTSVPAFAGTKITVDDDTWVNIGAGIRSEFQIAEDQAPNEDDNSFDFNVTTAQLFIGGQVNEHVGFTFNLNSTDGDIELMDAILQFEKSEMFNVWFGRFLPPTDRANNSGPFYQNSWKFPANSIYAQKVAGRDDGVAVWGSPNGGKFKYQVGLFEGFEPTGGATSKAEDSPLLSGRVTLNLWDPEPGYYSSSTYYGEKDILAVAFTVQMQSDAFEGTPAGSTTSETGDWMAWNLDLLIEKKLATDAVISGELAFYDRDTDEMEDEMEDEMKEGFEGDGFYLIGGYLHPRVNADSCGRWQPKLRYETVEYDLSDKETENLELDVGYIVDGHNTRFSFVLGNQEEDNRASKDVDFNYIGVGVQAIF